MIIIILTAIIIILLLLILIGVTYYNKFIKLKERVNNSLSQIDVELQKRIDLIPNLIETVKGYVSHEKETLEKIVNLRGKYLSAGSIDEKLQTDRELENILNKLLAISESYPDLKANINFLDLQNKLNEIEKRIGFSRQFYNDTVTSYNQAIKMVPGNIIAKIFNFKEENLFKAEEKAKEKVEIKF